jgi:hypothetical protein|tara:strand:- start:131 stop:430 length:300 start_codon:yes stop_codon:yes gene_type:complete
MISATTMELGGGSKQANVVFDNGPKMVSLSIDNSCGMMTHMARADIRLLFSHPVEGGVQDVTSEVFGGGKSDIVRGTIQNMDKAMKWLQRSGWGFDRAF